VNNPGTVAQARRGEFADEVRRVFRSPVVNPKWIDDIKRHGYKGGFELAATVDCLCGYDATAHVVEDRMYERVTEAYVLDPETRRFFEEKDPWVLRGIVERLGEAMDRGLWDAPPGKIRRQFGQVYLDVDSHLEARGEAPDAEAGS